MKSAILSSFIGVGFLLLIFSTVWVNLFPGTTKWTLEESEQWSAIKSRLHNLDFVVNDPSGRVSLHGGPDPAAAKLEYEQLKRESDKFAAEFRSAHDRPRTTAAIMKWTGIAMAGLGVIGWLIVKDS